MNNLIIFIKTMHVDINLDVYFTSKKPNLGAKMKSMIRLISVFLILFSTCDVYGKNPNDVQGHGIYNYDSSMTNGSIEWWTQIDPTGQTVFLFKSIKENTTVEFIKVAKCSNPKTKELETVVVLLMMMKADDPICRSMTEMQELKIALNPLPVKEISLTGKTVGEHKKIRIITPQ